MISLKITTLDLALAEEISTFLLTEKLILKTIIQKGVQTRELIDGEIICKSAVQITSITRASLFDKINQLLKEKYEGLVFTVHSVPIVYMDWEIQTQLLQEA